VSERDRESASAALRLCVVATSVLCRLDTSRYLRTLWRPRIEAFGFSLFFEVLIILESHPNRATWTNSGGFETLM
jgi:hypothetical protein